MNSSGAISLAGTTAGVSIEIENGGNGTTQISLNDTAVRTLAGVPSGAITMPTNFYGKSNAYTYTVSSAKTNFCMRAGAVTAGWNGTSKLIVNINSGVIISSNGTGTPAMTISGSFPAGVTVNNSGTIVGMGGNGGRGGNGGCRCNGVAGCSAGTALYVRSSVTFNNTSGTIAGGGGGGGGGVAGYCGCRCSGYGGGGGGGGRSSNAANSSGGAGGGSGGPCGGYGCAGGSGTYSSAGGGGAGSRSPGLGRNGGNGGSWGATGCKGEGCAGSSGGAGGKATCGAGTYITWSGTGTRYGSIS
jgi:hypothetical protein